MTLGVGLNLALRLDRLATLLAVEDEGLSVREIGDRLGYHKTMIGSLRSWARHLGLLDARGRRTRFATTVLAHDPELEKRVTRTLLYARIASNPAAEMFFFLVNQVLYQHATSGESWVTADIEPAARAAGVGGRSSATGQHQRELALMLNLLASGAFADLRCVERADGRIRANPLHLPPAVVAHELCMSWPTNTAYRSFADLERPGGLARIALVGRGGLLHLLRSAEQSGWMVVEQEAGLDRVARTGDTEVDELLAACYAA